MKELANAIQILMTTMGGGGWFFGGADDFLYELVIFIVVDYVTGIMVAVLEKKFSSEVGFRGIFKFY
jgi:phage-related holin